PQPLRSALAARGRRLAARQQAAAAGAGALVVPLGALTGAVFRADRGAFCEDRLHPSADGYRLWARSLLPAVRQATGTPATI
ncbi:MAG: SGNH/GDSL hydrolase family protein, partial [Mycobacteriales bacterium]